MENFKILPASLLTRNSLIAALEQMEIEKVYTFPADFSFGTLRIRVSGDASLYDYDLTEHDAEELGPLPNPEENPITSRSQLHAAIAKRLQAAMNAFYLDEGETAPEKEEEDEEDAPQDLSDPLPDDPSEPDSPAAADNCTQCGGPIDHSDPHLQCDNCRGTAPHGQDHENGEGATDDWAE